MTPSDYGSVSFGAPRALRGRWEEKAELFIDPAGQEKVSRAIVYLNEDVAVGDYLYNGSSIAADPTTLSGSQMVRQFVKIPDLRGLQYERRAYL